jgi:very-short-patch-repair endonuclease
MTDFIEGKVCEYCGSPAKFQSVNTKVFRCEYKVTKCPGVIKKQQKSREETWRQKPGSKEAHMKSMSIKGNNSNIRKTKSYKERVGSKISETRIRLGLSQGEKNPNFEGKFTNDPEIRKKMRKPKSDTSKMGRYVRTDKHREMLSKTITETRKSNKFKMTSIEKRILEILIHNNIRHEFQFLIQTKEHRRNKLFFRHLYDFLLPDHNLIIEVDGDYWHSSIEVKNWDTTCSYVANDFGYRILRMSESYINNSNDNEILRTILDCTSAFSVFGDLYD